MANRCYIEQHSSRSVGLYSGCTLEASGELSKVSMTGLHCIQILASGVGPWNQKLWEFLTWLWCAAGLRTTVQGQAGFGCVSTMSAMALFLLHRSVMVLACFVVYSFGFSLLRTPISLLLEQIRDASNLGRLIGHVFHSLECVYPLVDRIRGVRGWGGEWFTWGQEEGIQTKSPTKTMKASSPHSEQASLWYFPYTFPKGSFIPYWW